MNQLIECELDWRLTGRFLLQADENLALMP
jgi:hypothetical protein